MRLREDTPSVVEVACERPSDVAAVDASRPEDPAAEVALDRHTQLVVHAAARYPADEPTTARCRSGPLAQVPPPAGDEAGRMTTTEALHWRQGVTDDEVRAPVRLIRELDDAIVAMSHRELVSGAEVVDLLLDLRLAAMVDIALSSM